MPFLVILGFYIVYKMAMKKPNTSSSNVDQLVREQAERDRKAKEQLDFILQYGVHPDINTAFKRKNRKRD